MDIEPEFLEGELWGRVVRMLQLGEESLVVLHTLAKRQRSIGKVPRDDVTLSISRMAAHNAWLTSPKSRSLRSSINDEMAV